MIKRRLFSTATWIDLESPTQEELYKIADELSIDPHIIDDIEEPTPYPVAMTFDTAAYLVLHFPTSLSDTGARNQEIDFIVGKNYLITVRYESIPCIYQIHEAFEQEEQEVKQSRKVAGADDLLERIIKRVYRSMHAEIDQQATALDDIERNIFAHKEKEMVREISSIASIFLRFEKVIARHEESLEAFLADLSHPRFFGPEFKRRAQNIQSERDHAEAAASNYRDIASDLRTTNDSLLTASQNEVIKRFTMLAFFTLPISLMAHVLYLGVATKSISVHPIAFWLMVLSMVLVTLGMYLYFKYKKWL